MAFWRKKDEDEDLQGIKDKIERSGDSPQEDSESRREMAKQHMPPPPPPEADVVEPADEAVAHAMHATEFAPLFVKIDRYKEILEQLEEIKVNLRNLTDVMVLLNEIEHTRDSTVKALREGVSDLTDSMIALDSEFVRPDEAEIEVPHSKERQRVEEYVGDLRGELTSLKKELARLK